MDEENVDQPWWKDFINAVGRSQGPQTAEDGSKIYITPSGDSSAMSTPQFMVEKPSGEFEHLLTGLI